MFVDPNALSSVAAFHRLFRAPILASPAIPSADRCKLRVSLLKEEVQELADAIKDNDLVEIADALADIQYVLSGAVLEFGMGGIFKTLFDDVQRSNMSKACKTLEEAEATRAHYKKTKDTESYVQQISDDQWLVYRQGDDKALKSVEYSQTDLAPIVAAGVASPCGAEATFPEPESLNSVAAFHRLFRCPVVMQPAIPSADRCQLRVSLLEEEVQELADAIKDDDLTEVADALADIQYVLSGAVHEFGMGHIFKTLFDEVQRSNMSKACATMEEAERTQEHYRATKGVESTVEEVDGQFLVFREGDRKVLKSVEYSPASLKSILDVEEEKESNEKIVAPRASPTSVRTGVQ